MVRGENPRRLVEHMKHHAAIQSSHPSPEFPKTSAHLARNHPSGDGLLSLPTAAESRDAATIGVGKQQAKTPPGVCRSGATFRNPHRMLGAHPLRLDHARMVQIAETVAGECGITLDELRGPSRREHIAVPRMLAYTLQIEDCGARASTIGNWWGKTRGTVEHGVRETYDREETIPTAKMLINTLRSRLGIKVNP